MKKILVILSILVICIIILTALEKTDELDDYEIKPVIYTRAGYNTGYYTSIQFIEKVSRTIVYEFDIDENNPYAKNYPLLEKGNYNYYLYDLSNIDLNELKIDQSNYVYKTNLNHIRHGSCVFSFFINKNYIICYYTFNYLDESKESILASSSYFYIFNSKGDLIKQENNQPYEVQSPIISENGRYLAYGFGGFLEGSGYTLLKPSYEVIDIHNDKKLIHSNISDQYISATPITEDNLVVIRLDGKNYKFLVYDFEKERVYSKIYDTSTVVKIKKITKDGFILGKKSILDKENEIHLYSDSFYEEVLNEY